MREITFFENLVYEATKKIPKGRVSTYSSIASYIGRPKAARAVGNALNKNPYAPQVPCHRVLKSDGSLGGFSFGSKAKIAILKKEGVVIVSNRVVGFKDILFDFKNLK